MQHAVGETHLRARPMVLSVALFLLLTLLVVVPAGPARAATFLVDSTTDVAGSGDLTDGSCDDGGGNCTLRAAVQEANGTAGADVITLAAATYTLALSGAEDAGLTGDLDITTSVTINGAPGGTTIDANSIDRVFHVLAGGTLTLNNVTITGGSAATGAGIQVDATGALDLNTSTLTANTSTGHGGGIYAAGNVTADLVTISGNTAGTAAGDGGGFYSAGGTHTLDGVTVAFNTADNGSGLANGAGTLTVGHTIVATNILGTSGPQCSGSISTAGYNVISNLAGCTLTPGTGDTVVAAGIAGLADNGGPTQTHALNAASNSLDVGGTCSATDQRGVTRGTSCDAGSYEAVQMNFSPASATHGEFTTQALNVTLDGSDPNRTISATVQSTGGTATAGGTDYTLSGTAISFAPGTSSGQSSTVAIVADDIDEGASETATFGFTGVGNTLLGTNDAFTLTITDNDTAGITLTPTGLTFTEGGPAQTYDIELASQPTAAVTVNITDGSEANASLTSVSFTTGSWNTPQTVSVSVPNNAIADGTRADAITHASTSTDTDYSGAGPSLSVTINDDDSESITVTETLGSTDVAEAGATTDTYSVTLGTSPVGTVTITPSFGADVTVTPSSHAFTSADWNTSKTFTVTAVNDQIDEDPVHTATITHGVTAPSDAGYAALTPSDVVANVTDNDTAGVTVAESLGSTGVAEAGTTTDTYDVVLVTRPTDDVTVTPSFGPDVTVTPGSLTFTDANWGVAQTFTVTAVDDGIAEPDPHTAIVSHVAGSTDTNYDGILVASVSVSVADDDNAGVTVDESAGSTSVSEAGATTDTYTVVLDSVPAASVTITPSFGPDVTVTPSSLLFTTGNWGSSQTFTVQAVNDAIDEASPHFDSVTHAATSSDGVYDGISIASVSVSVADNDTAAVNVVESLGSTSVDEDGATTDTYDVTLGSRPTGSVTVTPSFGADVVVTPASITILPGDWATGGSFTVTAVDDFIDEFDPHFATITHVASSGDGLYDGISVDDVVASVADDDTAGVTVVESGGTSVSEDGATTDTYTVVLTSRPTAPVDITPSFGADVTVTPASRTFTPSMWASPLTFTVTAVDDTIDEFDPHFATITHDATSTDSKYAVVAVDDVVASVADDDDAGVTIVESAGSTTVSEVGPSSDTYTVRLDTAPAASVTVTPSFGADVTVTPSSLTFTTGNWNSNQTFTVTAVNDFIDEPSPHLDSVTHAVTSVDTNYDGIAVGSVSVSVTDNDTAAVNIAESLGSTSVDEDGATTDTYDVTLGSRPTASVTVTPSFGPDVVVTPASITILPNDWATGGSFTVTAVDDFVDEPDPHNATITHVASSGDGLYDGISVDDVVASVADDDTAGVTVVESGGTSVSEAGATTDTYTVRLDSRPSANVTVTPSFGPDVTVTPSSLVFTNANWASTQTFTVQAVNDFIDEPDPHTAVVTHAAGSIDSNYDGISIASVSVSVADDDVADVIVVESGGTAVSEAGTTSDTYTVRLATRPTANVTIDLTVSGLNGLDVVVSPPQLTFTNANWASTQTVTVTAVDDFIDETSPHAESISHAAGSIDGNYDGISIADVSVAVTDNDTAGVTVVESGGTSVSEAGATTDTYTVVLTSRPTAPVDITPSFGADVTVTPASHTFTPSMWASPLTFTVTAVDDTIDEFDPHFATITHDATSTDANYAVVAVDDVVASVADDDDAGVTIVESAGSTTVSEVGPSSDTYTVRLDSRPSVSVTITPSFGADVTVTPSSLTFTTGNWNSNQTFTVTAVDDFIDEVSPHFDTVTHAATSGDANYDGITIADVVASITDDDTAAITIVQTDGSTVVSEAGATTDTYTARLATRPTANVTVTPSFGADVTVTPASVVFTAANWSTTRTFTVTAVNDDLDEISPHAAPITHAATSGDPNYGPLVGPTVNASVLDNDTAGVTITPTARTIQEGAAGQTYTIVLDTEPTGTVNFTIDNTTGEANALPATLAFGPGNWSTPRTVTITAPDNGVADGARSDTLTHTVTSGDGNYDSIATDDVDVTINDDEGPAQVDIEDVAQLETDGTTTFTFNVTVTPQAAAPITLTYSTAVAGIDPADTDEFEQLTNAQIVIPALTSSDSIDVDVYGDDLDESAERFRVNITGVVGGEAVDGAVGTINDDDATPAADNETYGVDEGATLTVNAATGVLVGDTDGDPGTLTAQLVTPPANHVGGFTLNPNGSFTYTNDGDDGGDGFTYRASDGTNSSSPATVTINVSNVAPTVSIDGEPPSSPEGTEINLTSTTDDPGNDTVTLSWTVDKDGVPFDAGTGPAFSFTPTDDGSYVVTLDADDNDGGTGSDSVTINVTNVNPAVAAPTGATIDEGDTYALDASFTDVGALESHTAIVNWGDGTSDDCTVSPSCEVTQTDGLSGTVTGTHTYLDNGARTVTVTVNDGVGNGNNTATVNVNNVAPTVDDPLDATIVEGDTYTFDGAFTDPGTDDTWSAEVNYENGAGFVPLPLSGMTFSLSNTYNNDSAVPRTVTVCIADDDQGPDPQNDGTCQTAEVTVTNAAPVVTAREDADVAENSTVTLAGAAPTSFIDAGVDDTHTATVDWGEGGGPEPATVNQGAGTVSGSHFYGTPGLYTVTISVEDDGTAIGTDTFVVNVQNLAFTVPVNGPQIRNEGGLLTINGSYEDTDGIGTYRVYVDWGDGSPTQEVEDGVTGAGTGTFSAGPHKYADDSDCVSAPGSCTLVVTIDDQGSADEGVGGYTVTVNNLDPTTAVAGPASVDEGTWVQMQGNASDVVADTLTYEWTVTKDTGDGPAVYKTGTFENIWFRPDDGCTTCVYEATFTATDDDGGSTTEVVTVDVANVAPEAIILDESGDPLPPVSGQGEEGTTVTLEAAVTDPGEADTHTYSWEVKLFADLIDFGDQPTFDFVAPDNGTYFIVLTVTDDDGDTDTVAPIVTVTNAAPKITELVTDPTPSAGSPVSLNVFFTEAGAGDENAVTVDWGDGTAPETVADVTSPAALTHTFSAGAHQAQICVSDDDGGEHCKKIWYNAGGGAVSVAADFNGDGIQDMAVGVPGENSGAGAVNVLYGAPWGPKLAGDQFLRQGVNGVLQTSEAGDEFGSVLAHGDFNGDGYDDLAIGAPGEGLSGKNNAGAVNVLYGSAGGLTTGGDQVWSQDSNYIADVSETGDRFGASLATGDFNGDGFADLAIGVPGEDQGGTANAGRVQIIFGSPSKLVAGSSQTWHQNINDVLDANQANDNYGSALAGGDFDSDGFWDLAIGVPGQSVAGNGRSGAVAILPGSVLGLTSVDNQFWHQNKSGVNDTAEANDEYGSALAAGDFDNDGFIDLAIGIPLEGVGALSDAGAVAVMYGSGSGIDAAGDQLWHEDSSGIYGVAAADDQFGFALAVGDSTGDNYDDIVIGIPNQAVGGDAGAGTVALIRGSASGLSATGNQRWHEDRAGTLGAAQPGDHYGYAVAFLDVAGDGLDDLIAGIPGQNFSPADVGAVAVVRGHFSGGFTRFGDQYYHQNINGVAGDGAQAGDEFGGAL